MTGAAFTDVRYLAGNVAERKPKITRPRQQQRTLRGQLQPLGIAVEQLDLHGLFQAPQASCSAPAG